MIRKKLPFEIDETGQVNRTKDYDMSLYSFSKKILNYFLIERRISLSQKEFRWSRLILICCVVTALFDLLYISASYVIDFPAGMISQFITFCFFLVLIAIIKFTKIKNITLATLFALNCFQTVSVLPYFSGGIAKHSLILPWLSIVPVIALLLSTTKRAWIWYFICVATLIGYGFIPEEWTPVTYNMEFDRPFLVIVYSGLILIIFILNLAFKSNEVAALKELEIANQRVTIRNEELKSKNEKILSSINYAYMIQQSILPDDDKIKQMLPDSFVFFKPKDVVSGDFYWIEKVNGMTYFAAVDCTGHGVPGAFMSLIGNNLLYQIVHQGLTETDDILTELNKQVYLTLDQDNTKIKDGMDLALCRWDEENNILTFSGAKNPLVIVDSKNGLRRIRGDKCSIGGAIIENQKNHKFNKNEFTIDEPTMVYLFSDGFQDQFGGEDNTKFSQKRMRDYFEKEYHKPVKEQEEKFNALFGDWQGAQNQIDDVLLTGVRLKP